jgi:hypothetical protein
MDIAFNPPPRLSNPPASKSDTVLPLSPAPTSEAPKTPGTAMTAKLEAILRWRLANPTLPLSVCAAEFSVTEPWLSSFMNTDLFKKRMAEAQEEMFGDIRTQVRARVETFAHAALSAATRLVADSEDLETVNKSADLALKALGMMPQGARGGVTIVNNENRTLNVGVSKERLADLRQQMLMAQPVAPRLVGESSLISKTEHPLDE